MNQEMIDIIRNYFSTQPVERAWLFGSFARGEQTPTSDIDILITLDRQAHVGLLKFSGMRLDLKDLLNREIDLVEEGSLKSYVVDSVNNDKKLIYERTK